MTRLPLIALAVAGGLTLAGCTDGYGYSGVSVGYGAGYGLGGGYAPAFYDGGVAAYGNPYWGWYDDYYYPGTGYYVYDRYRQPRRWDERQQAYWEGRRRDWQGDRREIRDNWLDYAGERRPDGRPYWREWRGDRQEYRRGNAAPQEYLRDWDGPRE